MADLELQRKKRPVWLWLLGLAILVALVWIGAEMLGDDESDDTFATAPAAVEDETAPNATEPGQQRPEDLQAFRSECGTASTVRDQMDQSHAFEAECLNRLAGALSAVVERDTVRDQALEERLDVLRQNAERLTQDPQSSEHAAQLREGINEVVLVMEQVAEASGQAGDDQQTHVSELREAAADFEGSELLLEQKRAAAQFFEHAATMLESMSRNQGGR